MEESERIIKQYENTIDAINEEIDLHKQSIGILERNKAIIVSRIQYEKSAIFSIDWLPLELKQLPIYFPKKYHIFKKADYPIMTYTVAYDNNNFTMTRRLDMDRPDIMEINDNVFNVPIQYNIYYNKPNQKIHMEIGREYSVDLKTSIGNAKNIVGNAWNDSMAFGIAIFYYWVQIYYLTEFRKYKELHEIFSH